MHAEMIRKLAKSDPAKLKTETPIWQLYQRLLGYVWQHRLAIAGGIVSIFALSCLQILIPQITRYVIDILIPARRFDWLPWVGFSIMAIALLLGLLNFVRSYLMAVVAQRTVFALRRDLYEHLQTLSLGYFDWECFSLSTRARSCCYLLPIRSHYSSIATSFSRDSVK
jgi:subfamily B ATP-binding cassette protein MsbA